MKSDTYWATVHQTDEIRRFSWPEALTPLEALAFISSLNREAHVYGITYWTKSEDFKS